MILSQARYIALHISVQQNGPMMKRTGEKLVPRSAILLAGLGVGVSSFSLKQLLSSKRSTTK